MPPIVSSKVFNIPYPGGTVIVATLIKYVISGNNQVMYGDIVTQYSDDGVTVDFPTRNGISKNISVNDGVMTVRLAANEPGVIIVDCRCCLIPGDPFA